MANVDLYRAEYAEIELDTQILWGWNFARDLDTRIYDDPSKFQSIPLWSKADLDDSGLSIGLITEVGRLRSWVIRYQERLTADFDIIRDRSGTWRVNGIETIGRRHLQIATAQFLTRSYDYIPP